MSSDAAFHTSNSSPSKRLLSAVLCQAFRDLQSITKRKRQDARAWLLGETASRYASLVGYDNPKTMIRSAIKRIEALTPSASAQFAAHASYGHTEPAQLDLFDLGWLHQKTTPHNRVAA